MYSVVLTYRYFQVVHVLLVWTLLAELADTFIVYLDTFFLMKISLNHETFDLKSYLTSPSP